MSFSRREWRAGRPGQGFKAQFGGPGAGWEGSSFRPGTEHEAERLRVRQPADFRGLPWTCSTIGSEPYASRNGLA